MSDFKSFKKADLAKVAKKVGLSVRSKDTKQSLLEKIELFIEESPEKAKSLIDSDLADEAETSTLVEENEATEEEEDDDEEESAPADSAVAAEDDPEDKDYNAPPPIDLKELIVDPAISFFECAYDKVLEFTDRVGITTAEYNDELRDSLSTVVTLNWLEAAAEVSFFLYFYVPLVPIKYNNSIHQVLRDNIPQLNEISFPILDVTALWKFSVLSIFGNWWLYAVALPLLVSYYVNFSRRVMVIEDEDDEEEVSFVVRLHKFDPVIFSLAKVLIFYFVFHNGAFTTLDSYSGIFHALKNLIFIQLGIYHTFVVSLGNFPIIIGVANIVIGLYSQFEDF